LNIVPGMGAVAGEALARHHKVDKVAFTGSTATGHRIMEAAAQSNLKKVTLELGGKSPAIICEDADIDKAVNDCYFALFFNQGQVCCSATRLFVHEKVYDEFVEKSVKLAKARKVGDPFTDVEQGPQVNEVQFNKVMGFIKSGQEQGATLAAGGKRHGNVGYYVEPTVFTNVKDDMKIAKDEHFGPIMSIMKWNNDEDVIRRANNTEYGLAAGIWTKNIDRANTMSRNIRAGTIWINCFDNFDAAIPFGGYKKSGFGSDKGIYALQQYCNVKTVQTPLTGYAWR